jgi:hypothetical protein
MRSSEGKEKTRREQTKQMKNRKTAETVGEEKIISKGSGNKRVREGGRKGGREGGKEEGKAT